MLTMTYAEHESRIGPAKETVRVACKEAIKSLKNGKEVSSLSFVRKSISLLHSTMYYKTGKFEAEEYFNVQTPSDQFKIFSNLLIHFRHGK